MEPLITLMQLDLYLQIAIPIGYISYCVSKNKHKDKPLDVIYISLIFSLISALTWKIIYSLFDNNTIPTFFLIFFSIVIPITLALLWKKWIHKLAYYILHRLNITNYTGNVTIFSDITDNTTIYFTQISVYLKSGKVLICDYTYDFETAPINGYRTDNEGNIAIYVTVSKIQQLAQSKMLKTQ